jgi:hypothetical protein
MEANNLGQAVGNYYPTPGVTRGFFYDPAIDPSVSTDLNDLDIAGMPEGWAIQSAEGLNDRGGIVGILAPSVGSPEDPSLRRGFILDMTAEPPALLPLPNLGSDRSYGTCINDNGDVVGVYDIGDGRYDAYFWHSGLYDDPMAPPAPVLTLGQIVHPGFISMNNAIGGQPAQVAGNLLISSALRGFRWTPEQPLFEAFQQLDGDVSTVHDINDSGTLGGWIFAKLSKKPGRQYPFRFHTSLELLTGSDAGRAWGINNDGDLAAFTSDTAYYYHNTLGFLKLTSLIDPNDPNAAIWSTARVNNARQVTNRDGTGFGSVSGGLRRGDNDAHLNYLLTPFVP